MIITELQIDSFAGLHNRSISLGDGINIITGKNESGKSSLCDFVRFILFGITDAENEKHCVSSSTGKACGSMTVIPYREKKEAKSMLPEKIRIEREYIKGKNNAVKITDAVSGAEIPFDGTPGEFLLGSGAVLYDSTAYVSQTGGRTVNGQKLSEAIKNILLSADETIDPVAALRSLDDETASLSAEDGEISSLLTARASLLERIAALETNAAEHKKAEEDLFSYQKRIEDNAEKLSAAEQRVRSCEAALVLEEKKDSDATADKRDELIARRAQIRENASYEGFLPNDAYIERISYLRDSINEERALLLRMNRGDTGSFSPEKARRISGIESDGGFRDIELRAEDSNTKKKAYLILAFILFAIFAVAVCVGMILLRDGEKRGVIPILIGLTSLAGTVITIISRRQAVSEYYEVMNLVGAYDLTDLYRILDTYERERELYTAHRSSDSDGGSLRDCTDRINEMETELTELLSYWSMESVAEALECYNRFTARLEEIDHEIEQQNVLFSASESNEKAERREKLYDMLGETAPSSAPADPAQIRAELETARREYGFFRGAADALLEKKHEIELRATEYRAKLSPLAPVKERLSEVEAILERKKKKAAALTLASEKLRLSADALQSELAPALARRVSEICREISDGRYKDATVGADLSLSLSAWAYDADGASNGNTDIELLSGGTRDMAYIALRLALLEQLYGDHCPAVIFDESFCHMDDDRLRRTLSTLYRETCSRGMQMLILSSQEREREIMSNLSAHFSHTEM